MELKTTSTKGTLELVKEICVNGAGVEPIKINGIEVGVIGYANQEDLEVQTEMLKKTYAAANGSSIKMMTLLSNMAKIKESKINTEAAQTVEVNNKNYIIDYSSRKAYSEDGKEVAKVTENLGDEATKLILIERIKNSRR